MKYYKQIIEIMSQNKIDYYLNEPLSNYTSVKIGGKAKIFAEISSKKQFVTLLDFLTQTKTKYYILGNGTNTLACDENIDAVVICTKKFNQYYVSKGGIYVNAGLGLFKLNNVLCALKQTGLEFSYGIPGTVGGAVAINAGAYDGCVGNFVNYVVAYVNGRVKKISGKNMQFGYRTSLAQKTKMVILGVKFKLNKGNAKQIKKLQNFYFNTRLASQPYDSLSFGSAFKRNANHQPVSKLVDMLGLKGYQIGGAQISKKHAGFIINVGFATCKDFVLLIKYIQKKVFENFGFVPEPEVKLLGV